MAPPADRWTEREIRDVWLHPPRLSNNDKVRPYSSFKCLLRKLWNDQELWDQLPSAKNEVLVALLDQETGLVGQLKSDYPLDYPKPEDTNDQKEERRYNQRRQQSIAANKRMTDDQKNVVKEQWARAYIKRKERIRNGLHVVNEDPDVKEKRLWNWLKSNVIDTGSMNWVACPMEFKNADETLQTSYKHVFDAFNEQQKRQSFDHLRQLERFVDENGGSEEFYGERPFYWNVVTWWSLLLRLTQYSIVRTAADCIDLNVFAPGHAMIRLIKICVRGKHVDVLVYRAVSFLYHCHGDYNAVSQLDSSHLCHRGSSCCVNPSHLIFEPSADNIERNKCVFGSRHKCPHAVPCVYVNIDGFVLSCKNELETDVCNDGCQLDCFRNVSQTIPSNVVTLTSHIVQPLLPFDKLLEYFEGQEFRRSFSLARFQVLDHVITLYRRFVTFIKINDQVHVSSRFNYDRQNWIKIVRKLVEHIELPNDRNKCFEWTGQVSEQPENRPTMAFHMNNRTIKIPVAKALAFLTVKTSDAIRFYADNKYESTASHLCFNKYCVNWSHIQLETISYNNSREFCINGSIASCPHSPQCIFVQR